MGTPSKDYHHHQPPTNCLTRNLITRIIYILLPLVFLHFYFFPRPTHPPLPFTDPPSHHITTTSTTTTTTSSSSQDTYTGGEKEEEKRVDIKCDYSEGTWVSDTTAMPLYNGTSCATIKDGQNCMAHGRPDTGYLHWRWHPNGCHLPIFDPATLLRLLQNKHLAFIGDSMARNQLESLLCLLSTASPPQLIYRNGEDNKFRRWRFPPPYNATVSVYWSPFLVKGEEKSAAKGLDHNNLYLDDADERWVKEMDTMDVIVLSAGHWFLHPAVYFDGGGATVIGCHYCPGLNHTEVGFYDVFGRAFRTALNAVINSQSTTTTAAAKYVVVTTFSPAHFEGEWDKAGACPKKEPYKEGEKEMEWMDAEMRRRQVVEVEEAGRRAAGEENRVRIEALDVTKLAMMRPDGHPGPYMYPFPFGNGVPERVQNDCVHWCLPGPIDTWNEIFLQMVQRWRSEEGK